MGRRQRTSPVSVVAFWFSLWLWRAAEMAVLAAGVPPPGKYDDTFARRMVAFSSVAYQEPDFVDLWDFPNPACNSILQDFRIVESFRARDTAFGYVALSHSERLIVASFKGTNDTVDWVLHNLDSRPMKYLHNCTIQGVTLPGNVHKGFCKYVVELADLGLNNLLIALHGKYGYDIVLTGHSLGGAAAAIATVDLMTRFPHVPPPTLYTFGEPRVGDYDFAKPLIDTNRTFRVVHHHDIVPHVAPCCHPTCSPTSTCPHHHGTEVWFNTSTMDHGASFKVCDRQGEDWSCSNSQRLRNFNIDEHKHYYGVSVGGFCGEAKGGDPTGRFVSEEEEEGEEEKEGLNPPPLPPPQLAVMAERLEAMSVSLTRTA